MAAVHTFNGLILPDPGSVYIGPEVQPEAIAPGVTLHPGTRISGERVSIGPGSVIGSEGPATVVNCQLEKNVTLGSGYFEGSVFLDGASMGGSAHVRPGCLLEEQASGAHSVGLKQTVLLPFVTLGSLINFCDGLMAGGTSRKNHSEVGSSYIHFNYTPRQDKATASLLGDVPHGVLLNQPPIFLGGQGGLVGPALVAFGTVVPAGQILRRDVLDPSHLVVDHAPPSGRVPIDLRAYGKVDRIIHNNLAYLGNLNALKTWYRLVRSRFMEGDAWSRAACAGAVAAIDLILKERIKRLGDVAARMPESIERLGGSGHASAGEAVRQQQRFADSWPAMEQALRAGASDENVPSLPPPSSPYLNWIASLDEAARASVSAWLGGIVEQSTSLWHQGT